MFVEEFQPVLEPGEHRLTLSELETLVVSRFGQDSRRMFLLDGFKQLLSKVRTFSFVREVWVNGSFLTEKELPRDIDVALLFSGEGLDRCTDEYKREFGGLEEEFGNGRACVDIKMVPIYEVGHPSKDFGDRTYEVVLGWFAKSRIGKPKGFVKLSWS